MAESIKKRYRFLIIVAIILIAIPVSGILLIRTPAIQTFIVNRVTSRMEDATGFSVSIGKIHLTFIKTLYIKNILIADKAGDTLLYAGELKSGIRRIGISDKTFHLGRATAVDPVFRISSDSSGITNLSRLIAVIKGDSLRTDSLKTTIKINQIDLSNGKFIINLPPKSKPSSDSRIDFSNMVISEINAIIENFSVSNDTTSLSVYRASFVEKSGFSVGRFSSDLKVTKDNIQFENTDILTDSSNLTAEILSLSYEHPDAFRNFTEDVKLKLVLNNSLLSLSDLSCFISTPSFNPGPVNISGNVSGYLSELRGRNISLTGGKFTELECDFDLSGLPDIDNTYIFLDIGNLTTKLSELTTLNLLKNETIPEQLKEETGIIKFRGTFTGFTTDFVTYGKLFTEAGTLSTDISLRPSGRNLFRYQGLMKGDAIDAGRLTGNSDLLGNVSFMINVDGVSRSFTDFEAILNGTIDSAEVNGYVYRDIKLNGNFSDRTWDGSITINDDNLEFDFLGMLDFRKEIPEFDFSMNIPKANLFSLNIDKADSTSSLNMLVTANFTGNNFDNASGEIRLLNSTIQRNGRKIDIYNASLNTLNEVGARSMDFNSDFLSASMRGDYSFSTLPESFRLLLSGLIPSRFMAPEESDTESMNRFTLNATLLETGNLNEFLQTGLTIAEGSTIKVVYDNGRNVETEAGFSHLGFNNNTISDVVLKGVISGSASSITLSSSSVDVAGIISLEGFGLNITGTPDTLLTVVSWDDKQKLLNRGAVGINASFARQDTILTSSLTITQSDLWVNNEQWKINPSEIIFKNNRISVTELLINSTTDFYRVSGVVSDQINDSLKLDFKGIDLGFINSRWDSKTADQGKLHLAVGGVMSGKVILTGMLGNFMMETDNVVVEGFRMINHEYGTIHLNSVWDNSEKIARLELYNDLNGKRAIDIGGFYDPGGKIVSLKAVASGLPVDILNPILSSFASGIGGYADGEVQLSGTLREPELNGALFVKNGTMRVDYLQTQYSFNDSIRFNKSGILFKNITVSDDRNNPIRLNGLISHNNFRDFGFDISFNPVQAKVLDTRQKDNDIFYGTAFATGVIAIRGSEGNIAFDISAKTDRNTRFFVPFNNSLSIGDYSFVTFTSSDLPVDQVTEGSGPDATQKDGSLSLNFDLDVTPDAEVQLVLDAKAGDVMRGRGSGKLNINLTPRGDFTISGDYIITSGDYLFTLGNIVNKRFNVDEGSKISWNGDISDADIDINARYRLETSLYDLLHDERFKDRIPVECLLHMTGKLLNPVLSFDIILPTADEQTRSYVRNAINTEEEMIRQFVYLLAISRFYPDPAFRGGATPVATSDAGMSAIGNTMEMLSNQITNWLSQISNDFDVGFVYRPGNEISAQEVEVALSTQILNDRVTINGNFDVGADQTNSSATTVTGVFDVEVAITEKLKFKFFNRSNDNLLYETSPYTQGIGLFFRHEFDSFRNIFRRKNADAGKREEQPEPVDSDNSGHPGR